MTEPRFAIGDRVAVCTLDLSTVIPRTFVTGREYSKAESSWSDTSCKDEWTCLEGWYYTVADGPVSVIGQPCWFHEQSLRHIPPDEYDETPTTTERGITA